MSFLWTTRDMVDAMDGRPVGNLPEGIAGISIDTRTLSRGEAFFAIRGDRFDGHDFVSAAIAAGAELLVVSEARLPALGRLIVPVIVVDDVLAALGRLGMAARARSNATVIAVTGSVGKTTTKTMLAAALAPSGKVHAAVASFNNHWGVPLTLARMPEDTRFGVFEIGMNHRNEIRPLVKMVRPHIAIVTTIAAAHLGHFKNLNEIAAAKAEIFEGLVSGGAALVNRDNEKYAALAKAAKKCGVDRIYGFGQHAKAEFRLLSVSLEGDSSRFSVDIAGTAHDVRLGAAGRHVVDNALAVLGAVSLAGADVGAAGSALAAVPAAKGRGARHRLAVDGGSALLIDESYNANPASMRAALDLLATTPVGEGGRRIAVLGDMLELGRFSDKLHAELAGPLIEAGVDSVYMVGSAMAKLDEALDGAIPTHRFDDAAALAAVLSEDVRAGDAIVVKSSLGLGFGRIVTALTGAHMPADNVSVSDASAEKGTVC